MLFKMNVHHWIKWQIRPWIIWIKLLWNISNQMKMICIISRWKDLLKVIVIKILQHYIQKDVWIYPFHIYKSRLAIFIIKKKLIHISLDYRNTQLCYSILVSGKPVIPRKKNYFGFLLPVRSYCETKLFVWVSEIISVF